ncbi:MAG: hypothetical protein HXS54_03605 [Theionarchaea archaeon]|nr:hypothetical protein [Theionarchaea archaeon]
MTIYVVKTGSETLRVREEDFGCTIWSRDKYAEGDASTLDVLRRLSEGNSIEKIASDIAGANNIPLEEVYNGLLPMFQELSRAGWFLEELKSLEEKQ